MKILISKLPASGWWSSGIPKYQDNPAMREGERPNHNKLVAEREKLISILKKENQTFNGVYLVSSLTLHSFAQG